jgi:hypothetical protein
VFRDKLVSPEVGLNRYDNFFQQVANFGSRFPLPLTKAAVTRLNFYEFPENGDGTRLISQFKNIYR